METFEILKTRAKKFLNEAKRLLNEGVYDLSAFHFEQAAQLYVKYYLWKKLGDFPKTHSLKEILVELGKAYRKEKIVKKFIDKNISVISDLEEAYITSRYLPAVFINSQVMAMKKFVIKLFKFLDEL